MRVLVGFFVVLQAACSGAVIHICRGTQLALPDIDVGGSNWRSLASHGQPEHFSIPWNAPAWSPDGKTIACPVGLSDDLGQNETITGIEVASGVHRNK